MRESKIEKEVCKYARSLGWKNFKFTSPSQNGVPDQLFLRTGFCFFIEFKATGKYADPLQREVHVVIRSFGFEVYVVDDIEHGKRLLDTF